jgi:integrase
MEQSATCLRDRLLVRLLFHLACRISEALALKVEDIDLDRGSGTIVHLKSRVRLLCPESRLFSHPHKIELSSRTQLLPNSNEPCHIMLDS